MENLNEKSFVVNLHVLENCNFHCKYCFSKFESKKILSLSDWKNIIDNICETIKVERFNIAGGEPLLYPKLEELIDYIYSKNIKASIITNGYF